MLASPANQLSAIDSQGRTTNLLTLHVSGAKHQPVLLSPGKWNIGSAASNQIVLNDDGIEPRQFLIVVTEHRSVIKDWSGSALKDGTRFDDAVLEDGDTVQIAGVQLDFRLAESLDLISQLPCVADRNRLDDLQDIVETNLETGFSIQEEAAGRDDSPLSVEDESAHLVAIGMVDAVHVENRLDRMIARIGASAGSGSKSLTDVNEVTTSQPVAHIDDELRQLEELRAAVQKERSELLARRELLARETQKVQSELEELSRLKMSSSDDDQNTAGDEEFLAGSDDSPVTEIDQADGQIPDSNDDYLAELSDDLSDRLSEKLEDEAVTSERTKLRRYLEEFDSVDDAEASEEVEESVAVGAAQLATSYNVSNALRSREDAVKRLDDLVLAATRSQPRDETTVENRSLDGGGSGRTLEVREVTGRFQNEEATAGDDSGDSDAENECAVESESVDIDASVEDLEALLHEADQDASEWEAAEQALVETPSTETDFAELTLGRSEAVDTEPDEATRAEEAAGEQDFKADEGSDHNDAGSMFRLNDSEFAPIADQPVADTSSQSVFEDSDAGSDLSTVDAEFSDADSESITDPDASEVEPSENSEPSWFESKFMTQDDSPNDREDTNRASESSELSEELTSENVATHSEARAEMESSDEGSSASELRLKLAQMFDLPSLPKRELPSDSRQTQPQLPGGANNLEESVDNESVSPWRTSENLDADHETTESSFDYTMNSEAESDLDFGSETLDAFPSSGDSELDSVDESASEVSSSFEPESQGEEEESISAYMERLLARNRQVTSARARSHESSVSKQEPVVSEPSAKVMSASSTPGKSGTEGSKSKPETWLDDTPRHRQNRDKVRADVQVLRQIANQSARSAVATASRRDVRKQVIVKTTASLLALGSGVAALLLDISMLFGLVVFGIGMLFSADLSLTIFRNWVQLRKLKQAAVAVEQKSRLTNSETSEDDSAS